MCDHTYCYTPAVQQARASWSRRATLGDILFVDSVRINLGLVQPDVDVFWDLAPHDLSILDFILPGGLDADGRRGARRRPDRRRQGLRRLPDAAAGRRGDRPRPRQLAQPHQDPPDGHRRQPADAGLGRPQPAAAPVASTTGASTSTTPRTTRRRRAPSGQRLLPARATCIAPALPEQRGAAAHGRRVRGGDPRGRARAHRRRGGPAGAVGARGGAVEPATRRWCPSERRVATCRRARCERRSPDDLAAGSIGPGHRRGRHHRVHDRRPAPRRRRGPRRRPRQPGPRPPREPRRGPRDAAGRRSSRATSATATSCTT